MRQYLNFMVLFLALPFFIQAWNGFGHMEVAAVAWDQLTDSTKKRVSQLLAFNPYYVRWVKDIPEGEKEEIAFLRAATWPDEIKSSDSGYHNDGEDPVEPGASLNIGYDDKLQHRYWHYINFPFSTDGTAVALPKTPNIQTQLVAFIQTLASEQATDDVKSYDLVWFLHLIGDVHQPLHTATRFCQEALKGDAGGNKVLISVSTKGEDSPYEKKLSLHAFWDNVLGTSNNPQEVIKAVRALVPPSRDKTKRNVDEWVKEINAWINESFQIAQQDVYGPPIGSKLGPYQLDQSYRVLSLKTAKERVALAGSRLAAVLNSLWGN